MPSQFFLYGTATPSPSPPRGTSHVPFTHEPVSQSWSDSQDGAVWHVPSWQSSPCLHCGELSQASPQSLRFAPPLPSEQPGKSGGHSSFAAQRSGGSASSNDGGSPATCSAIW